MNNYKINAPHSGAKEYVKIEIQRYKFDGKRTNRIGKMKSIRTERYSVDRAYVEISEALKIQEHMKEPQQAARAWIILNKQIG